jgi:hypothetical protein
MSAFDLSVIRLSSDIEHSLKAKSYQSIYQAAEESKASKRIIKLCGFAIGIASVLLTLAKRIGRIAEGIIKGFINIFGAPFLEEADFLIGLKQLFVDTPFQIGVRLPLSIVVGIFSVVIKTACFAYMPKSYAKGLWMDHDPKEKDAQIQKPKITVFAKAKEGYETDPANLDHIKTLAECYQSGIGVSKNDAEAIKYYKEGAILGDPNSMKMLGDIYAGQNEKELSIEWYDKAAKEGDLSAMHILGIHYYVSEPSNVEEAMALFSFAAENGHVPSNGCLFEIHTLRGESDLITDQQRNCPPEIREEARLHLGITPS